MEPIKNYLSGHRFAHSLYCGYLGRFLSEGGKPKDTPAMERGLTYHALILTDEEKETNEAVKLYREHLKASVGDRLIGFEVPVEMTISGILVKGIIDLLAKDQVIELKTGSQKEWHFWQASYYAFLTKVPKATLVYLDISNENVVSARNLDVDLEKYKVTEELLLKVWQDILNPVARKGEHCRECPVKPTCPEWIKVPTPDILELTKLYSRLKTLEETKAKTLEVIEPVMKQVTELNSAIKETEEAIKSLKEKIKSESEEGYYYTDTHKVLVYKSHTKTLPPDLEIDYSKEPDLFTPPKLDTKKAVEKYGISKEIKAIRIEPL